MLLHSESKMFSLHQKMEIVDEADQVVYTVSGASWRLPPTRSGCPSVTTTATDLQRNTFKGPRRRRGLFYAWEGRY